MIRFFPALFLLSLTLACGGGGGTDETTQPPPTPDTQNPSIPVNIVATMIDQTSIALSWDASSDNVSVSAYGIYRDGVSVNTSNTTTYTDNNLTANTAYNYQVLASDSAGNSSSLSTTVSFTTLSAVLVASEFKTSISVANNIVIANGMETIEVTVQAKTIDDENLIQGGDAVTLSTSFGTIGDITDNNDGSYTATLTSSIEQGLAIITGSINGKTLSAYSGVANRIDKTDIDFIALASLGKLIFEDTNLSEPVGQACASCHDSSTAFVDPDSDQATSLGADDIIVGKRNAQTAGYAAHVPQFQTINKNVPIIIGGQFTDGRSVNLKEQAKQPFINPDEMNNFDEATVVNKIKEASYVADFEAIFGVASLDDVTTAYDQIAQAIAAFEQTNIFSPFTSKFDDQVRGTYTFTDSEQRGSDLFFGQLNCDRCHSTPVELGEQLFSNFEYSNIGVPANQTLIAARGNFVDNGLGDESLESTDNGKFRTPNLRNIANTAPYMHNGVFLTLREVIDFYNADLANNPEVNENLDSGGQYLFGGLTETDKNDLEAFLNTLSDQ
ncbi:MAG: hypothetical protein COA86_08050 [Kangiella sp.]|nr:MAG: hypothetical protein COA86_08050 [Kangiella sp.]